LVDWLALVLGHPDGVSRSTACRRQSWQPKSSASRTRFRKNGPGYRELRRELGENLLTSEDESWHRQRRFLAPIFTRRRIASEYVHIMIEEAERLIERWQAAAAERRSIDLFPEMVGITSRVIGRILLAPT
jgi:cytochrome P450